MSMLSKSFWPHDYPTFWRKRGVIARLLQPLSGVYGFLGFVRQSVISPIAVDIPVVCIGNLSVGGVGKTPVVAALVAELQKQGIAVHILAHGYGGAIREATRVCPQQHHARDVGDEALLHAEVAPTWTGRDRVLAARLAHQAGAELLLLDDGWQNPKLQKDRVVAVVNADDPFGNGLLLPAGSLRQKPDTLHDADVVIAIGERVHPVLEPFDLIHGRRQSIWRTPFQPGDSVFAFCGLGRSQQFTENIQRLCIETGVHFCGIKTYPDHYPWDEKTLNNISQTAESAHLVTSAKDWCRLPEDWQRRVRIVDLNIVWTDSVQFVQFCQKIGNLAKKCAFSTQ